MITYLLLLLTLYAFTTMLYKLSLRNFVNLNWHLCNKPIHCLPSIELACSMLGLFAPCQYINLFNVLSITFFCVLLLQTLLQVMIVGCRVLAACLLVSRMVHTGDYPSRFACGWVDTLTAEPLIFGLMALVLT